MHPVTHHQSATTEHTAARPRFETASVNRSAGLHDFSCMAYGRLGAVVNFGLKFSQPVSRPIERRVFAREEAKQVETCRVPPVSGLDFLGLLSDFPDLLTGLLDLFKRSTTSNWKEHRKKALLSFWKLSNVY